MVMWFSFIMFLYLGVKIEYFAFLFTVLYRIFTTSARRGDVLTVTIHLRYFHVRGWCSKGTGIHLRYSHERGDVSKGTGIHLRYFRARGWCFKGTGRHLATFRKGGNFLKVGGAIMLFPALPTILMNFLEFPADLRCCRKCCRKSRWIFRQNFSAAGSHFRQLKNP